MQHTTSQDIIKVALTQAVLFYMPRPKMMQPLIVIHVVRILKWPGIEASGFPTRTFKNNVSASKSSHPWGFVIFKSLKSNKHCNHSCLPLIRTVCFVNSDCHYRVTEGTLDQELLLRFSAKECLGNTIEEREPTLGHVTHTSKEVLLNIQL